MHTNFCSGDLGINEAVVSDDDMDDEHKEGEEILNIRLSKEDKLRTWAASVHSIIILLLAKTIPYGLLDYRIRQICKTTGPMQLIDLE